MWDDLVMITMTPPLMDGRTTSEQVTSVTCSSLFNNWGLSMHIYSPMWWHNGDRALQTECFFCDSPRMINSLQLLVFNTPKGIPQITPCIIDSTRTTEQPFLKSIGCNTFQGPAVRKWCFYSTEAALLSNVRYFRSDFKSIHLITPASSARWLPRKLH